MGLLDKIKNDVKKSGQSKSKFAFFREGEKVRIRFLQDMDEGMELTFHDNFQAGINVPCQEQLGRSCEYCDSEDVRTRSLYAWTIWNYEANEVQIFMFAVNQCSPVPALMALYETYGTLTDRDYVISVSGKQQNKTFSVVPMDKAKFRNTKAQPYTEKAMLKMIDKAFPCDSDDEDDEPAPRKKSKPAPKTKSKKEVVEEDEDYEDDELEWNTPDEDDEIDYSEMSAKELFKLCKEKSIDCETKKPAKYYVNLLEEYDNAQDDWGDEDEDDDEDEWED